MTNKHFDAILAKNCIARHIKDIKSDIASGKEKRIKRAIDYIVARLNEIEAYTGAGNQPSVNAIMESNVNI